MFESTTSHFFIPSPLRRTTAVIAGSAICELLPQAVLIGGGENEVGFFYDFLLDTPPVPELAVLLKEKMREILSKKPEFREMEMVVFSAQQLLKKKNQLGALGRLEEMDPKELVSLVQLKDFIDLAEGPFQKIEKVYLDHFSIHSIDEEVYRLQGCVDTSQDALKSHVKKIIRYEKQNHLVEGEKCGFWLQTDVGLVWQQKGLSERRKIFTRLKEIFCEHFPEVAGSEDALFAWSRLKHKPTFWYFSENFTTTSALENGLFSEEMQNFITLEVGQESHISDCLLQEISKFHTIFGFRPCVFQTVGRGRYSQALEKRLKELGWEIEKKRAPGEEALIGFAQDGLGRMQKIWELKKRSGRKEGFQFKIGVERILALLVEMNLGK